MNGKWAAVVVILVFVAVALVCCGSASGAKGLVETINQTFGEYHKSASANAVQQTTDGGFIIAGDSNCGLNLLKTDSKGTKLWNRSLPYKAEAVQQTTDGGYIIAGTMSIWGGSNYFYYAGLLKTDSNGTELWNRTFGSGSQAEVRAVQQTTDGGFIIAGSKVMPGTAWDIWLIKTDSNGTELWNTTAFMLTTSDDYAYAVQQTTDGGYIVAGVFRYPLGLTRNDTEVCLVAFDSNGTIEFADGIDHAYYGNDGASAVQQTTDGGYIIAGYTDTGGAGGTDIWLLKTKNESGFFLKEWDVIFGGAGYDRSTAVELTTDGGFILAGYTDSFGAGDDDVYLIKTNSTGKKQWEMLFGGSRLERAAAVQQTTDGGYIVAGYTQSYGPGHYTSSIWLLKVKELELLCGDVNGDG